MSRIILQGWTCVARFGGEEKVVAERSEDGSCHRERKRSAEWTVGVLRALCSFVVLESKTWAVGFWERRQGLAMEDFTGWMKAWALASHWRDLKFVKKSVHSQICIAVTYINSGGSVESAFEGSKSRGIFNASGGAVRAWTWVMRESGRGRAQLRKSKEGSINDSAYWTRKSTAWRVRKTGTWTPASSLKSLSPLKVTLFPDFLYFWKRRWHCLVLSWGLDTT